MTRQKILDQCKAVLGKPVHQQATKQWEDFHAWWRGIGWNGLGIDQYTNLLADTNGDPYFTLWIESRTSMCGRFSPSGGSKAYGIYKTRGPLAGEAVYVYRKQDKTRPEAEQVFLPELRAKLEAIANGEDVDVEPFDVNYARKVAYMFNPSLFLPLYKSDVIQRIAEALEITTLVDAVPPYLATQVILADIRTTLGDRRIGLEDTQNIGGWLYDRFAESFDLTHKNVIFYGPPGTGKTYSLLKGIEHLLDDDTTRLQQFGLGRADVLEVAQFHPSYTYEDFIEGLRPEPAPGGGMQLRLQSGRFKAFCKRAMDHLRHAAERNVAPINFYFVADEINRAELSRVLGEVLVCLEPSKRLAIKDGMVMGATVSTQYAHHDNEESAVLALGGERNRRFQFGIPENVYFFGTMNDVDRSIDNFDMALRRRFVWKRKDCDYGVLDGELGGLGGYAEYKACCKAINDHIRDELELGPSYEIGHAYFLEIPRKSISEKNVRELFESKLRPLLREYLRASYDEKSVEPRLDEAARIFSVAKRSDREGAKQRVGA